MVRKLLRLALSALQPRKLRTSNPPRGHRHFTDLRVDSERQTLTAAPRESQELRPADTVAFSNNWCRISSGCASDQSLLAVGGREGGWRSSRKISSGVICQQRQIGLYALVLRAEPKHWVTLLCMQTCGNVQCDRVEDSRKLSSCSVRSACVVQGVPERRLERCNSCIRRARCKLHSFSSLHVGRM